MALVPALLSLHRAPSVKFIESAARERTLASPSTASSIPAASLTTIRCSDSLAMEAKQSRISGAAAASG
jgi:hypothetical protein